MAKREPVWTVETEQKAVPGYGMTSGEVTFTDLDGVAAHVLMLRKRGETYSVWYEDEGGDERKIDSSAN